MCEPCGDPECTGWLQPCTRCNAFEECEARDFFARGGAPPLLAAMLRAATKEGSEHAELRESMARIGRAREGEVDASTGTTLVTELAARTRVSEETWRGLGRKGNACEDRAFAHD